MKIHVSARVVTQAKYYVCGPQLNKSQRPGNVCKSRVPYREGCEALEYAFWGPGSELFVHAGDVVLISSDLEFSCFVTSVSSFQYVNVKVPL
jgi:hypothetical protein